MKVCMTCKQNKYLSEFYNCKSSKDGKGYRCKSCDNKARTDYNRRNPDRFRELNINRLRKHKYGLSTEDVEGMYIQQNGACKICNTMMDKSYPITDFKRRQVIDHCHTTGKVRGLLCARCNQALGLLEDNIETLESALKYLKGNI